MTTDNDDKRSELDKDIEELDQFLEEQDDHFPFDDEDDQPAPNFEQSKTEVLKIKGKRSVFGRIIGYFIFLLILGGIAFAGIVYAPKLIDGKQMDQIRGFIGADGQAFIDDMTEMAQTTIQDVTGKTINLKTMDDTPQDLVENDSPSLPMPSDIETGLQPNQEEQEPVVAETIADALNIAQQGNEGVADVDILSDLDIPEETSEAEDLMPINNDAAMIEADIADMNAEEVEDIVAVDEVAPELPMEDVVDIVEQYSEAMIEDVVESAPEIADAQVEQTIEAINDIVEDTDQQQIPSAPEMSAEETVVETSPEVVESPSAEQTPMPVVDVETKVAQPVIETQKPKAEVKSTQKPKTVKPEDVRVNQARSLYEEGNYASALSLYQAVLADDPANTAALTGRQLAQAKLRLSNDVPVIPAQMAPTPAVPQSPSVPMVAPTIGVNNGDIQSLLNMAQQSPRDARIALNVADAYKQSGDKANAMEWYRKALQLDVLSSSGLDRMVIYDSMADLQN